MADHWWLLNFFLERGIHHATHNSLAKPSHKIRSFSMGGEEKSSHKVTE